MTLLAPSQEQHERSAQHRRSPWIALLLLMALGITLVGIFPFRQIIAQHRQVDMTQGKLDALLEENALLEDQVELLQTPTEMERIAREQFGVVRQGETAYIVTRPQARTDVPADPTRPVVVDEPGDERGVFARMWDFLTGRDLVPDG